MPLTEQQVRAWAAQEGLTVPARGKVGAATRQLAEDAAADAADAAADGWTSGSMPGPGDGGAAATTAADEPPGPAASNGNGAAPASATAEARPRRPARPSAAAAVRGWGRPKGKAKSHKAKPPARPRVPVDTIISGAWEVGARFLAPVNIPVSRVMAVQAPVAGIVLEPIVKGTIVDRWLQPVARTSQGAEALAALAGPPLVVAALQARPELAPVLVPMLRELLGRWIKVAGPAVQIAADRAAEFEAEYGATVDGIMEMCFAGIPGSDPDAETGPSGADAMRQAAATAAEDEAIRRAQGMS